MLIDTMTHHSNTNFEGTVIFKARVIRLDNHELILKYSDYNFTNKVTFHKID
jgi:hypothetical protein